MSRFSRMRFRSFVAWNVYTVLFLPILVFWLFLFSWVLCCLYCIWLLWSDFLRAYFLCSFLVVLIHRCHLETLKRPLPFTFLDFPVWQIWDWISKLCLYVSLPGIDSSLCIYHWSVGVKRGQFYCSQWIILPTLSYSFLYSICPCLLRFSFYISLH